MAVRIELELEERVLTASKIMVNILAESLIHAKVSGLPAPQFRILDMVYHGLDKPSDIARMLDVSPSATTWLFEKLEDKGFIERTHSSSDRRRVVLELTGMGKDVVRRVNAHRRKLLGSVLGSMSETSVKQLQDSLEAFSKSYLRLKEAR